MAWLKPAPVGFSRPCAASLQSQEVGIVRPCGAARTALPSWESPTACFFRHFYGVRFVEVRMQLVFSDFLLQSVVSVGFSYLAAACFGRFFVFDRIVVWVLL